MPRTRAAAAPGLSIRAFDAGCTAAAYVATEWHHSGKFAARVAFFDTAELMASPEFWSGASTAYASATKRAALLSRGDAAVQQERAKRRAEFATMLAWQRTLVTPLPPQRKHRSFESRQEEILRLYYASLSPADASEWRATWQQHPRALVTHLSTVNLWRAFDQKRLSDVAAARTAQANVAEWPTIESSYMQQWQARWLPTGSNAGRHDQRFIAFVRTEYFNGRRLSFVEAETEFTRRCACQRRPEAPHQ